MMEKIIKCDYCNYFEAVTKDYRADGKHLSCRWCAGLNDVAIYQIQKEGINPIDLYDSFDFEKMDADTLLEIREYFYDHVNSQLSGDGDRLDDLLEVERALTLLEEV